MNGLNKFVTLFLIFLAIVLPTIFWAFFPSVEVKYHDVAVLYLKYFLLLTVGVQALLIALTNTVLARQTASNEGQLSNTYQHQFAFAALGVGALGVLSYWMTMPFMLATVIVACCTFLGVAASYYTHRRDNDHNGGMVFVSYILSPIFLIALLIIHYAAMFYNV